MQLSWYVIARNRFDYMRRLGVKGVYFVYKGKFKTIGTGSVLMPAPANDTSFPYPPV